MDGLFPAFELEGPFFSHGFYFLRWKPSLFFRYKHWMDDDFRRIWLDGWRTEFRAEDMREVSPYLECRDGRIEGRACKLEGPTHDSDPSILSLLGSLVEIGEDSLESAQELQRACRHSYLSELLFANTTAMDDSLDHRVKTLQLQTEN